MRLSSLASARPAYYDRNATSSLQSYNGSVAPHSATTRWTVTIATGRKAIIEQSTVTYTRLTAATTLGLAENSIQITSGATTAYATVIYQYNNAVYANGVQATGAMPTLYAGETLACTTYDQSTGGTVFYHASSKLTLYDA